ncbi:MAG: VanZ family protein [Acidobacteria bacterium]|nr:VanZ family protein [Acidobacteriota bacterium]
MMPPAPRRHHLALAALAWTAFAVYGSLVPLEYRPTAWDDAVARFRSLPPLWVGIGTRADWVANILLFIPLTFLWLGTVACDRGRMARLAGALVVLPLAAAGAVALEFTQIWFARRTVSRNDILAEAIGGGLGVLLWFVIGQRAVAWARTYSLDRRPQSRVQWLLQAYIVGFTIWSVIPLDLTISVTELYHKWERGQVTLLPFAYRYESWSAHLYQAFGDLMVFVPLGIWIAMFDWGPRPSRAVLKLAAMGGAAYGTALELVQLLVLSRYTDVTDILFAVAGSTLGAWLVLRQRSEAATTATDVPDAATPATAVHGIVAAAVRWGIAIGAYTAFLLAGFLFPFEVTHDRVLVASRFQEFARVPLFSLYMGTEFNAIQQVLVRLLLFAPLGALWGRLALRARGRAGRIAIGLAGLGYAAALALAIELAQLFMPPKIADPSDAALCLLGAAGGLYVAARALVPADDRAATGRTRDVA